MGKEAKMMWSGSRVVNPPGLWNLAVAGVIGVAISLVNLWASDFSQDAVDSSTALGIAITLAASLALWLVSSLLSRIRGPFPHTQSSVIPASNAPTNMKEGVGTINGTQGSPPHSSTAMRTQGVRAYSRRPARRGKQKKRQDSDSHQ